MHGSAQAVNNGSECISLVSHNTPVDAQRIGAQSLPASHAISGPARPRLNRQFIPSVRMIPDTVLPI